MLEADFCRPSKKSNVCVKGDFVDNVDLQEGGNTNVSFVIHHLASYCDREVNL